MGVILEQQDSAAAAQDRAHIENRLVGKALKFWENARTDGGLKLHLSEVKGPVMDRLERTHLIEELSGKVYLSQSRAFAETMKDDGNGDPPVDDLARGLI